MLTPGLLDISIRSFPSIVHVIVDTVKQAEEDDELIVPVYEAHGARGPVTLTLEREIQSAVECNLLEPL